MYTCYWEEMASCTFSVIGLFRTNRGKLKILSSTTGGQSLGVSGQCIELSERDKHVRPWPGERKKPKQSTQILSVHVQINVIANYEEMRPETFDVT